MHKRKVVVAGASGFVGQALAKRMNQNHHLIGLSRAIREPSDGYVEYRKTDLFSLKDCESALEGANTAVYLVHSMMPSARLVQGSFEDLDLLCADNFARAAKRNGVEQIIYLGGLLPSTSIMSPHLRSREEVERVLASSGVPVTTLRAGLIIGEQGSSFQMVLRLVKRLPMMLCPAWTSTLMQPVSIDDVVEAISLVCGASTHYSKTYDLGCPEPVSYRTLLERTATALELQRRFVSIPMFSPTLSRLWVSLTTGAPKELVAPLVESLTHEMTARPTHLLPELAPTPLEEALEKALRKSPKLNENPRAFRAPPSPQKGADTVRSVQRMLIPEGTDARWATNTYFSWLPVGLSGLVRVEKQDLATVNFTLFKGGPTLLSLSLRSHRSDPTRNVLRVTGGLLARETERGRLEFRQVLGGRTLIAAIHDFEPRLPWWLYRSTQAHVHYYVMHQFRLHLATSEATVENRSS